MCGGNACSVQTHICPVLRQCLLPSALAEQARRAGSKRQRQPEAGGPERRANSDGSGGRKGKQQARRSTNPFASHPFFPFLPLPWPARQPNNLQRSSHRRQRLRCAATNNRGAQRTIERMSKCTLDTNSVPCAAVRVACCFFVAGPLVVACRCEFERFPPCSLPRLSSALPFNHQQQQQQRADEGEHRREERKDRGTRDKGGREGDAAAASPGHPRRPAAGTPLAILARRLLLPLPSAATHRQAEELMEVTGCGVLRVVSSRPLLSCSRVLSALPLRSSLWLSCSVPQQQPRPLRALLGSRCGRHGRWKCILRHRRHPGRCRGQTDETEAGAHEKRLPIADRRGRCPRPQPAANSGSPSCFVPSLCP
jgi:hypothetical protein